MACLYADGNIPAEKETVCFYSFLAILNLGRCPCLEVRLSEQKYVYFSLTPQTV